jgi:hypothetical protein
VALSGSPPQSNGDQPAIVPLKPHNYRFILDSNGLIQDIIMRE